MHAALKSNFDKQDNLCIADAVIRTTQIRISLQQPQR